MEGKRKMSYTIITHDVVSGEIVERDMTSEEITERKAEEALWEQQEVEKKAKESQRTILLNRLGLTEEEARLLLS
jgi:hypothetical protein